MRTNIRVLPSKRFYPRSLNVSGGPDGFSFKTAGIIAVHSGTDAGLQKNYCISARDESPSSGTKKKWKQGVRKERCQIAALFAYSLKESNLYQRNRNPLFYPLN